MELSNEELHDVGSKLINACSTEVMLAIEEVLPNDFYELVGSLVGVMMYAILRHPESKDPEETALTVGTILYTIVKRELQERVVN